MKKTIFALLMAIVMLASAMTVYAYSANEDEVNKINPCPHTMIHDVVVGSTHDQPKVCEDHENCMYTVYYSIYQTVCMECGKPLSDTWSVYSHTFHNMSY